MAAAGVACDASVPWPAQPMWPPKPPSQALSLVRPVPLFPWDPQGTLTLPNL